MNPNVGDPTAFEASFKNVAQYANPQSFTGNFGQNAQPQQQVTLPNVNLGAAAAKPSASTGVLPTLLHKVGSIAKTVGGLAVGMGKFLGGAAVDTVEAPYKLGSGIYHLGADTINNINNGNEAQSNLDRLTNLSHDYKTGRITQTQYKQSLQDISKRAQDITKAAKNNQAQISNDSKQTVQGDVGTAVDILTLMSGGVTTPLTVALKTEGTSAAVDFLSGKVIGSQLLSAANVVENVITKVATLTAKFSKVENIWSRSVIAKESADAMANAGANLTSKQIAKQVATSMLFKKPLIYQTNLGIATDIYDELSSGKYGSAVGNLALAVSMTFAGGPIGLAFKQLGKAGRYIKFATFGHSSFLDELSKRIGNGNAEGMYNAIKNDPELIKSFQVMEHTNLKATNNQVVAGVNRITDWLTSVGWDLKTMSHAQVAQDLHNFAQAREAFVQAAKLGKIKNIDPKDAERITAGRWNQTDKQMLILKLQKADFNVGTDATFEARIAARRGVIATLQDRYGRNAAWLNNDNIQKQIDKIISTNEAPADMVAAIDKIDAQVGFDGRIPRKLAKEWAEKGYTAILPVKTEAPYVARNAVSGKIGTAFAEGNSMFQQAVTPLPILSSVGAFLSKVGLSAEDAGSVTHNMFLDNLKTHILQASGLPKMAGEDTADILMKRLANYAHEMSEKGFAQNLRGPITDYRQFTLKDIQNALGSDVTAKQAREVMKAFHTSMLAIPLQVRGLGDKIQDLNYKVNPIAGKLARAQGGYRFVYNPFFRWQQTTQAEFLAQMAAEGKFPTYIGWDNIAKHIFPDTYKELDATVKHLEERGVFAGGLSGIGADVEGAGKIAARLLPGEKRSLAGLLQVMAKRTGRSVDQFLNDFPDTAVDTMRSLVQYSKHEGFINSPLARTLNLAFFPMRYNLKVAGMMAKYISQTPAAMQVALIKSMFDFGDWLNTDEGQSWYSSNADAIQLFNWLSPLYPLNYVTKILTGNAHTLGDFGQLGGLPFGMISQMLDAQGLTHMNSPYLDPKTGDELPTYIPQTTKARANAAIQDLLASVFSYPGATAGLPSKTKALKTVAGGIIPGSSKEFKAVEEPLNAREQAKQDQIKRVTNQPQPLHGLNGQPMKPYTPNAVPTEVNFTATPPTKQQQIQGLSPIQVNQAKNARTSGPKKKESQYIPRPIATR